VAGLDGAGKARAGSQAKKRFPRFPAGGLAPARHAGKKRMDLANKKGEKDMKTKVIDKKKKSRGVRGLGVIDRQCIWMKAGVVNFKLCDNAYDCFNCPFDKSMQIAMGKKRKYRGHVESGAAEWANNLRKRHDGASRPCRHALTGRAGAPKVCALNYECYHCEYDQWLDECDLVQTEKTPGCTLASGYRLAEGYYYHEGHGWVLFEHGGIARVGFDDFLVRLFGTADSIRLPALGKRLRLGKEGLSFERGQEAANVLSPVSGKVLAVNRRAGDFPGIAHRDPYRDGWLCIVEPDLPMKDVRSLYYGKESVQWMESESRRLLELMGPEYAGLSSTGAEPVADVVGSFPELGWKRLAKEFLRT
jgi:glycine cleavage system H lipoate-binding protein